MNKKEHGRLPELFTHIWAWLIEPATSIQQPERRRQARLLSALLLVPLIPFTLLGVFVPEAPHLGINASFIVLIATYGLSRTRYYMIAAVLTTVILPFPIFTAVFTTTDYSMATVTSQLIWLAVPILMASLWFSRQGMLIVAAANMGGILLLPLLIPDLSFRSLAASLMYIGVTSGLSGIAAVVRHQNEVQINRQSQQLAESEERLRTVMTGAPVALFALNRDGTFTFAEGRGFRALDLEPEEFVGRSIFDKFSGVPAVLDGYRRALTGESFVVTAAAQEKIYEIDYTPHREQDDQITGIIAVVTDVTARTRTEEALKRANQRYRQLFEEAPVMYVITQAQEGQPIITDCNELFLRTLGYTLSQVLGRPLLEFYPPPSREEVLAEGDSRIFPDQFVAQEQQLVTREGQIVETLLRALPEIDPDGRVSGTRAMYVDITQRKRAEAEITQRNRELLALQSAGATIASSLNLSYVLNTVTHEMARLLDVEICAISKWDRDVDTVVVIAEYGPDGWKKGQKDADIYHLAEYPLTKRVLVERTATQLTISQPDIDKAELAYMQRAGSKTLLMLPMVFQDRVAGLVELEDSRMERIFTDQEISLAQLLANQAASAIQNAQLYEQAWQEINERKRIEQELREMLAKTEALYHVARSLIAYEGLTDLLQTITDSVAEALPADRVLLATFELQQKEMTHFVRGGPGSERVAPLSFTELMEGLSGWVMSELKPALSPKGKPDPRESEKIQQQRAAQDVGAVIVVPLQYRGETLGTMTAVNRRNQRDFTEQDVELMVAMANQAAITIENAHLYEQAQQEIAERKLVEAELEEERALLAQRVEERTAELSAANAELARAARLKDEFLANMSHELRTPLNAILGKAEAMREGVHGSLTTRQDQSLQTIEESGRHLLALINDILDLSKIEAGKARLNMGRVPLKGVCQASLRIVKQMAHKKQIELLFNFDEAVTVTWADERRLKQILVNLLSNAVKFTAAGGQVGLDVCGEASQEAIRFTIWDTGIGIAPEDMKRLFKPFSQLDSSLSRQYEGTGLGLSLVRRLVRMHGGGITLKSEVGKGSSFIVSLPWRKEEEIRPLSQSKEEGAEPGEKIPLSPEAAARAQPVTILLAEDNEANISTLADYLPFRGYQLIVVRDGTEVVEKVQDAQPDIILMDIHMPGINGLQIIRSIRADARLAAIPIIALTALAMPGDRERCIAAGADDYLSKPVSLRRLVTVIETQLHRVGETAVPAQQPSSLSGQE